MDEITFDAALNEITAVEAEPREQKIVVINAKQALSSRASERKYTVKEASAAIAQADQIAPYSVIGPSAEQPSAKAREDAKPKPGIMQGLGMPSFGRKGQQQPPGQKEATAAAQQMKSSVQQAAVPEPIAGEIPLKNDGLVLVSLSLPDQIAELEKIQSGIGSGSFTAEQMSVIRAEVKGLSEAVGREKPVADGMEKDLISLRNQRLEMAMKSISGS